MDDDDIIFAKRYSVAAKTHKEKADILNNREIKVEYANLRGVRKRVFRMYERTSESFGGVGWIVNDDIDECMVCGKEFYFFRRRHHCRSCGNLVCDSCSPHFVVVEELKEQGEVRVCVQCYWGQWPVYAARERVYSDSESEESADEDLDMAIASSQINANKNSSTKGLNVEVEDFLEYCELVVLDTSASWEGICSGIWAGLNMPSHMQADFEYVIVVDEDGDEISPTISDADSFWRYVVEISVTNKNKLVACLPPALKQELYQHRKNLLLEMKSPNGKSNNSSQSVVGVFPGVEDSKLKEEISRNAAECTDGNSTAPPVTPDASSRPVTAIQTSSTAKKKRRSSISLEDEALINLSRQRAQEKVRRASLSSTTTNGHDGTQEEARSNNTDEEDKIEDVDFSALALAEGPTPIVNVNQKEHTVVVQLKSGNTHKMSKEDSESLLLARRATAETFNPTAVSSPAHLSVVVDKADKEKEVLSSGKGSHSPATDEEHDVSVTPRLINKFHEELRTAFDELSQLSRRENPAVEESKLSISTFMSWEEVTRAVSEIANLDAAVVEEEFKVIAGGILDASRDDSLSPVIDFDGFCVLMERLETLGERQSLVEPKHVVTELPSLQSQPQSQRRRYSVSTMDLPGELAPLPDDGDVVMVPEELVTEYETLRELTKTVKGTHPQDEAGVSQAAILLWENIQEALVQEVLSADDVIGLFNKAVEDSRGETDVPVHPLLTLKEFYSFAVKMQVFVDEKCGDW
mmetsp:Transcript_6222/g.10169  ORF Transcript_6222/g.10169 Transcript_6222/m.10169 type:complete len:750 (-) Transcript_6222:94-2343(-)|eukprot:CAMPEP_0114431402 /NCGR_PEP_ID=MMETSP0103-20121206/10582_1 /TAXON_ID=37642 ORGANISM="Paraphysomonas imperforata, Strain PA2" /NCGR_SAMPLE_ID=MMETSP0103 /ASSEMBLY_ACC=CAM_ASM_000201 /LENGTH=749 /DNA_ID=CAMNT_0001600967 /DNA_START=21 /DNA_END=2270 /DNA_ORIENTATION=-